MNLHIFHLRVTVFCVERLDRLLQKTAHLSQVELQDVADVVRVKVRELHQVLAVLKRLAQFLHPRLGPVHPVDALQSAETEHSQHLTRCTNVQNIHKSTLKLAEKRLIHFIIRWCQM